MNNSNEIIFLIEEAPEGGDIARAMGESIFTETDSCQFASTGARCCALSFR